MIGRVQNSLGAVRAKVSIIFAGIVLSLLILPAFSAAPIIVSYYANWSTHHGVKVSDLPLSNLDVINYSVANICYPGSVQQGCIKQQTCRAVLSIPTTDHRNFRALQQQKQQHPHLKVLLSVGGGWQLQGVLLLLKRQGFPSSFCIFTTIIVAALSGLGWCGFRLGVACRWGR